MDKITRRLINAGIKYASKHRKKGTKSKSTIKLKNTQRMVRSAFNKTPNPESKRGRPAFRTEAELQAIKEVREMYNNLRNRIERVSAKYGYLPAVEQYYNKGLDKFSVKGLSLEDITKLRNDVEYVSSLRTSYVEGADRYNDYIQPILVDTYDSDKSLYNRIVSLYNRMVEENELAEKFKYEIITDIYTMVSKRGATNKEIYLHIKELFEELYMNSSIEDIVGGTDYATGGKVHKY